MNICSSDNVSDNLVTIEGLQAEICKRSFWTFIQEFWTSADTSEPTFNWHMKYLADELQKAGEQIIKRLPKKEDVIINIAPGTSKSMITSVLWPAWLWINDPTLRIISASYSSSTALELSIKTRNLLLSDRFQIYFPDIQLKDDEAAKGHYKTLALGGRLTTSTGSNVIGMHADVIIGDDLQNLDSVYSKAERSRVNRWVTGTLSTRKTDKLNSLMVFVQQRLHPQDLTAYLLSLGSSYNHIILPATLHHTLKPSALKEHYTNGYLDLNRLGPKHLEAMRSMLGSSNYNAQILQDPEDAENSIIKREWLKIIQPSQELFEKLSRSERHYFLDTAYGGANADFNVILEVVEYQNEIYILNLIRNKEEFPELIKTIKRVIQNPRARLYIEAKASGKSIIQTLKSTTRFIIKELIPKDGKLVRLNAIAPTVEGGRVNILAAPWTESLIDEVTNNNPINDDQRDTFTYATDELLIKGNNYGKYTFA